MLADRRGLVLANLLAAAELLDQMRNGRIAGIVVDATYRLHDPAELRR